MQIWDFGTKKKLTTAWYRTQVPSWAFAWSPDNRFLAAGGANESPVRVFNSDTGELVLEIAAHKGRGTLAWGDDGRRLLTCGPEGTQVWDASTAEQLLMLDGRGYAAWSHDQKRIAVTDNGRIRIHEATVDY
jgi:WD40 repeat protein